MGVSRNAEATKLRVLCLHGYHGSADIMRGQMAPLTRGLDHLAEFVYVDAPSLAAGDFGWWHAVDDARVTRYEGWPRTREWICSFFEREGRFDGVFGFSQGGALAGLLVGLRSPFDFAALAGGFLAEDRSLDSIYDSRAAYALPSVHLIGRTDSIIPPDDSRRLSARFLRPLVLEHEGGHVIPSTHDVVSGIESFFRERIARGRRRPVDAT